MKRVLNFSWYLAMAGAVIGGIGGHYDYAACCIGLALLIDNRLIEADR